jgi:hypothetical protein
MEYKPLDFAAFEIHLLTLQPAENGEDSIIHCTLNHRFLVEPPPYRALSYCWGDSSDPAEIVMNGLPKPVTRELNAALKQLSASNLMTLWVDALCINQEDVLERGLQVMRMGIIYSKAEEVVVWLGDGGDGSSKILSLALDPWDGHDDRDLFKTADRDDSWGISSDILRFRERVGNLADVRRSITALLERPYWKRVWIIQEVAKGRQLRVFCGRDSVPYDRLLHFLGVAGQISPQVQALQGFREGEQKTKNRPKLIKALANTQYNLSTDPRDKIYAILGLCSDGVELVPTQIIFRPRRKCTSM